MTACIGTQLPADAMDAPPATASYRMPAEWEPHDATLMIWPERPDNWRDRARPAQAAFAAVAGAIARFEPVIMAASPGKAARARDALPSAVRVIAIATNDSWARDIGPFFVTNDAGEVCAVDFPFNAWGGEAHGLYAPWDDDDAFAARVAAELGIPCRRGPCVLEGGTVHVDGTGTALVTEPCLLDPGRNPGVTRGQMEDWLASWLGIRKVIWLGASVPEDETGGHIDNLACFSSPGKVLLAWCDDPADPHYQVSRDALSRLAAATDAAGRRLVVDRLPMPPEMRFTDAEAAGIVRGNNGMKRAAGQRLAASYVNFYIANGAVIAPAFGAPTDQAAREVLARSFPDREIVMLPTREILLGGGNIHCITRQIPQARSPGPSGAH